MMLTTRAEQIMKTEIILREGIRQL
jgi:hypothetical protein